MRDFLINHLHIIFQEDNKFALCAYSSVYALSGFSLLFQYLIYISNMVSVMRAEHFMICVKLLQQKVPRWVWILVFFQIYNLKGICNLIARLI